MMTTGTFAMTRGRDPVVHFLAISCAAALGALIPQLGSPLLLIALISVVGLLAHLKLNWLFAGIFLVLPFLPLAPTEIGESETIFAVCAVLLLAGGFVHAINRTPLQRSWINAVLASLLLILLATLPRALSSGVTLEEWFRGFAPFSALALYFCFAQHVETRQQRVLYLLAAVALIWDIRVLHSYFTNTTGIGFRSTYSLASGHLPLSAFGVVVGLSLKNVAGWGLIGISIAAALSTATRGLVISIAISAVILMLKSRMIRSHRSLIVLAFVGIATIIPLRSQVLPTVASRFTASFEQDLTHRKIEATQALGALESNVLLGRGLGWGFDGKFLDPQLSGQRITYVHNSLSYFAMASGLLGLLAYHSLLVAALWRWFRRPLIDKLDLAAGGFLIVISLYGLFQAMFRLFHTNIFLALSLAILLRARRTSVHELTTEADSGMLRVDPSMDDLQTKLTRTRRRLT
jgi:hypothetical protein